VPDSAQPGVDARHPVGPSGGEVQHGDPGTVPLSVEGLWTDPRVWRSAPTVVAGCPSVGAWCAHPGGDS
jgi:hypothetical protein